MLQNLLLVIEKNNFYIIMSGKSTKTPLIPIKYRRRIYDSIVGKCGVQIKEKTLLDTCKVCIGYLTFDIGNLTRKDFFFNYIFFLHFLQVCKNKKLGNKEWVQCSRCDQWYHCKCVGLKIEDVKDTSFYCK